MPIVLADHRYGKAENRVVRFRRDTARHEVVDLNVTTTLRGDFADAYLHGDQSKVLPTDSQKNTAFAYAAADGATTVEGYALALARHFVDDVAPVSAARVDVEAYPWTRARVGGVEHDHTWVRSGAEVRTAAAVVSDEGGARVVHLLAGLEDLTLLKSTGSQFRGFLVDEYTTLPETDDRVLATSLEATWRYAPAAVAAGFDVDAAHAAVREALVEQFATLHSLALQQTLWHMGRCALERVPEAVEIRLTAPNKHHVGYDVARFGVPDRGEVFHADDRPYGLIRAVVADDEFPAAPEAWA
ncbi:factor-independent urate hydroxylase [Kineococcus sp. SYSU DK004]|uniref:factor-independent urate hydroxylase n=1 Tax=Kineococcus sp. SYSU DK004 TaxID=3383125 RepID=UPI003D7EF8F0